MQTLTEFELDAISGGSRVMKVLDWAGRVYTALEIGRNLKAVADAAGSASSEPRYDTSNPLEGNRNAK